jgi:hypothetical protein
MRHPTLKHCAAALLLLSTAAQADWSLVNGASSFYYVTSKAAAISEVNSFRSLSGTITDSGLATLDIDLASVDTAIEIRDQRMRDLVFEVAEYPSATVTVPVDSAALDAMQPGSSKNANHTATVELHGLQSAFEVELQLIKLDATSVQVQLTKPLLVGAAAFGLTEGVEQLREIAGLPSINPTVVVDFTLVYHKQ